MLSRSDLYNDCHSKQLHNYSVQNRLQKATYGLHAYGFAFSKSDIASIADVSIRTVYYYNEIINKWWNTDYKLTDDIKDYLECRFVMQAIKSYANGSTFLELALSSLLGIELKLNGMLTRCTSIKSVRTKARHIANVYKQVIINNKYGVCLHASNTSAKEVLKLDDLEVNKLFERRDSYKAGEYSKRWKPTRVLNDLMKTSTSKLLALLKHSIEYQLMYSLPISSLPPPPPPYVAQNSCKSYDTNTVYNNINTIYNIIEIDISILETFSFKSILLLLTRTLYIANNKIYVPIIHEACTKEEYGRTYNIFCRIKSSERNRLGYIGYDMNAALQSICLNLIKATEYDFPILYNYSFDKIYKKNMREKIAKEVGVTVNIIKSKLTAFANGYVDKSCKNELLIKFQNESELLRRKVMKHVAINYPDVLERAKEQSRRKVPDEINWYDIESDKTISLIKTEASIFFFVWTWFERLIRKAILTVLPDGIEVHDAVYSKMKIDPQIVQDAIYRETDFKVIIDRD